MKRILFFIMFFTVAISTRAQVTLDECRHAAQENYPLVRQYNLIQLAEQYNLSNASKGNLPQINISGKASYQSDATTFPIDIPGIGIKGLPKDQYQALIEVQQNIWDGGQIHHQKKRDQSRFARKQVSTGRKHVCTERTGQSGILRDIALKRTVASERSAP